MRQEKGAKMDYDDRQVYLLARQHELEREMVIATDRGRRDKLEAEYADVVKELERIYAGTWKAPEDTA